jgi:hypothetical protein
MTREQWFSLPIDLRRRWWRETVYGALQPSDDLKIEIERALAGKFTSGGFLPVAEDVT